MLRGVAASFYAAFRVLSRSYGTAIFVSILPPLFASMLLAGGWLFSGSMDLDKYLYQLVGSSLLVLIQIAMGEVVWTVRDYVREGLYEYILASPSHMLATLYGVFLAEVVVVSGLSLVLTAVIVGLLKGPIYGAATALAYIFALIGALPVLGIGLILASLVPFVRDPGVLVMPLGALLTLLGGVIYPLSLLPPYLEAIAWLLPVADLADIVRNIALGLRIQIGSLGLLGAYMLYTAVGLLIFQVISAYAKRRGVL